MLADARPAVLLTDSHLFDEIPVKGVLHIVCLDSDAAKIDAASSENPEVEVEPNHLMYVIFTSGSMGQPKGVMVTHHNVSRLFDSMRKWVDFRSDDVWSFYHSYAFGYSTWVDMGCATTRGQAGNHSVRSDIIAARALRVARVV